MTHLRGAGVVHLSARMYLTDRHGAVLDDITAHVAGTTVDFDVDRTVSPLLLRGDLLRDGLLDPYADYLQPWLRLEYGNGEVFDEPVGLYAVTPPKRRQTYTQTRLAYEGRDHTWRLATSSFASAYTVEAGAVVTQAVVDLLKTEGFTDADIDVDPSPLRLAAAATWDLDDVATKLEIANHLLAGIAYTPLHTVRAGTLRAFALPDLETAAADVTYTSGDEVTAEVVEDPDPDRVANVVLVINDQDAANPIVALAENHNPASPVSIENLGRRLFREIRDQHIPDQATAEAIALRALQEGATYDNRVTMTTGLDPRRQPHEVYEVALPLSGGGSALAGRWRCTGWTLGFSTADVAMQHQLAKVVPV